MTTFNTIALDFPEAQALAELDAVRNDLKWVAAMCERIADMKVSASEFQVLEGLTVAAVIRYARCFPPGVRRSVPIECVEALPEDLARAHGYFLDQRNGFFAHSVRRFELNHATVVVPASGSRGYPPERIGFQHQMLATLGEPDLRLLQRLGNALVECVSRQIEAEKQQVIAMAQQVPLEEYQRRDVVAVEIVATSEAGMARLGVKARARASSR